MDSIVEQWVELDIAYAEFTFNCIKDNLGEIQPIHDTSIEFYDNNNKLLFGDTFGDSPPIVAKIKDLVEKNVKFYRDNDNVDISLGESGVVRVTLNDSADGFDYVKESSLEYTSNDSAELYYKLTQDEYEFLIKYVKFIGYNSFNDVRLILYKEDFINTDEIKSKATAIQDNLYDFVIKWADSFDNPYLDSAEFATSVDNDAADGLTITNLGNEFYLKIYANVTHEVEYSPNE